MAKKYVIKDSDGNIVNTIIASLDYVTSKYKYFEEAKPSMVPQLKMQLRNEADARRWRDSELKNTDWAVSATDHPDHSLYMTYRQALRDWPSTDDFPDVRPTLRPAVSDPPAEEASPE